MNIPWFILLVLPDRWRCAYRKRMQCPAYHQDHRPGQWRCIRRRHDDLWHKDARGMQWRGEPA